MNKRTKQLIALLLCLPLLATAPLLTTGCKTTYQATAVSAVTVDKAMLAWGSYVKQFKPEAEKEQKVKRLYEQYQSSVSTVVASAIEWNNAKETGRGLSAAQSNFNAAVAASGWALSDLVNTIRMYGVKI